MTELKQRALAVALREHQEEQWQSKLFYNLYPARQFAREKKDAGCEVTTEPMNAVSAGNPEGYRYRVFFRLSKAEQAKKDAGDERLLCAVLYEKGEPN